MIRCLAPGTHTVEFEIGNDVMHHGKVPAAVSKTKAQIYCGLPSVVNVEAPVRVLLSPYMFSSPNLWHLGSLVEGLETQSLRSVLCSQCRGFGSPVASSWGWCAPPFIGHMGRLKPRAFAVSARVCAAMVSAHCNA